MAKHNSATIVSSDQNPDAETGAPQTFEEALAFALKNLADSAPGIPPDWLAALNREKESSSN